MEYTVDYFIDKFNAIDSNDIGVGSIGNHCALWHCGLEGDKYFIGDEPIHTDESLALCTILEPIVNNHRKYKLPTDDHEIVWSVNDGNDSYLVGNTPKERILACLNDIKTKQNGTI